MAKEINAIHTMKNSATSSPHGTFIFSQRNTTCIVTMPTIAKSTTFEYKQNSL